MDGGTFKRNHGIIANMNGELEDGTACGIVFKKQNVTGELEELMDPILVELMDRNGNYFECEHFDPIVEFEKLCVLIASQTMLSVSIMLS
ncbi:unnamed protein product [Amaranthus hypochondriacus]